jgi:DNA-binding FrmR family transcriptional regulator
MPTLRDAQHQKALVNRLRRVEGQLRGSQAMIVSGADCEALTPQLSASRRALDKAFFAVLSCAIQSPEAGGERSADKRVAKVANLLEKFG